jgi:broad specificity phosphatase PhoE
MHKKLFLIRHGETDYNLNHLMQGRGIDAPLNETGELQALAVAEYLERYDIDHVISSSMLRARQTAGAISKKKQILLQSHADLDEMNFGDFEGENYLEITDQIQEIHDIWVEGNTSHKIPGGESPQEVLERTEGRIQKYLDELEGDNLAFVIHGRVIRIILSVWTGLGLNNMHRIEHANGAINHLTVNSSGYDVVYLNKTSHLRELTVHSDP